MNKNRTNPAMAAASLTYNNQQGECHSTVQRGDGPNTTDSRGVNQNEDVGDAFFPLKECMLQAESLLFECVESIQKLDSEADEFIELLSGTLQQEQFIESTMEKKLDSIQKVITEYFRPTTQQDPR